MFSKFTSTVKKQIDRTFQPTHESAESKQESNSPEASDSPPESGQDRRQKIQNVLSILTRQLMKPIRGIRTLSKHPKFWLYCGLGVGFSSSAFALIQTINKVESTITESISDVLTYMPPGTLVIKSADGIVLQEVGEVTHEPLKIWQIPDLVKQAFIASEDRRFQFHGGADLQGILRAAISNLQAGEVVEGGSTITQQLARIVFLNQERTYARKYREVRLAQKIEHELDKPQILERYLNLVYLGSGAYGVADAAWIYFSKPLSQLTIAEAATLAGIVPAPSNYSPIQNPELAKQRRDLVLKQMTNQGFITDAEAESAIATPINIKPSQPKRLERTAPYFTDYIRQEVNKLIAADVLQSDGIIVETTLNSKWQEAAEAAIEEAINSYGGWQRFQQGALVAIDPRNGQIKAMVGGSGYAKNQFNRVTQAQRQPGSTFKTFVYTTAMAAGFSPNRAYLDSPYTVDGYTPENYGDKYRGTKVALTDALAASLNVVAVQLLIDVGWEPTIAVAQKMGIASKMQPTYSLALGSWEVNLLELTSAYGVLANNGIREKPYGISRIRDRNGKILYQASSSGEQVVDLSTAALTTWILQGVVERGTGAPAQIGRPVAGKTGTSDEARDLWFVGYIPQLVTGVWLGNDNNQPTSGASTTAAATWRRFMLTAVANIPKEDFPIRPTFKGRKVTVKAKPLKPKRVTLTRATSANPSRQSTGQRRPTTSRRRRSSSGRSRTTSTRSGSTRQAKPATRNQSTKPAAPAKTSVTPPPPAAAPAPAAVPLAPPAGRKSE